MGTLLRENAITGKKIVYTTSMKGRVCQMDLKPINEIWISKIHDVLYLEPGDGGLIWKIKKSRISEISLVLMGIKKRE